MYEYFFMHSEEIDMCWQLISEGFKIKYCPDSCIYHLGGGTLAYQSPRKTYLNFRNNIIMCFRNSPWYILLWLTPVRLILDIIASLKFLGDGDAKNCIAVFKAYKDFIKWLATEKNKFPANKKSLLSIPAVLKKSIVWEYYIREIKYYSKIKR
jgi:GT2 family glycosyltransferase